MGRRLSLRVPKKPDPGDANNSTAAGERSARRRSSFSAPSRDSLKKLVAGSEKKMKAVYRLGRSIVAAADKAAQLLQDPIMGDEDDFREENAYYGLLYMQRVQGQLSEFEER